MVVWPQLAVGPMSREAVEAAFAYSGTWQVPLMLIASRNQIDKHGGYVNGWTTKDYMDFVGPLKAQYPTSNVLICRDHCGPGFKDGLPSRNLDDTYETVEEDIRCGFGLIHIDLCRADMGQDDKIAETKKLMRFALVKNPAILFEVGTDENDGQNFASVESVRANVESILEVAKPTFYVLQTGTLIKEAKQVGHFEAKLVSLFHDVLHGYDVKLKEHNADYLTHGQIQQRRGLVDALNIAPQLGVVQTSTVLNLCLIHGVNFDSFLRLCHEKGKWKKWSIGQADNQYASALIAGHYHFNDPEYRRIVEELEDYVNVKKEILANLTKVINHYVAALGHKYSSRE